MTDWRETPEYKISILKMRNSALHSKLTGLEHADGIGCTYNFEKYTVKCRWCGVVGSMATGPIHKPRCHFFMPCIDDPLGLGYHRWALVGDRERDNILGTGGWDLQYMCTRDLCDEMLFLTYAERLAGAPNGTATWEGVIVEEDAPPVRSEGAGDA